MSEDLSLGHQITMQLMPVLMIIGAVMSLGANFWLPPFLLLALCFALVVYWLYTLKDLRFQWKDLRFLILPSVVLGTGFLTFYHLVPAFYDEAYHLQISNRILDRWDWEPTHQGMSYSFRPEILSGIAAIELWLTGEVSTIIVVPTLLFLAVVWSIQHLGERFSDWRFGFIAGAVFCTFPIVIRFGRSMMLDVALAGMIVSVFHHLEMTNKSERSKLILIGVLSGVIGLTKYPYLYLGGWIVIVLLLRKEYEQSKFIAAGYSIIIGLFLVKNQIHTGWIFGPLQSQITGTMASIGSTSGDTVLYTPHRFFSEFVEQWPVLLLCIALYGTALLIKNEKKFVINYWVLILPVIFLHGFTLNFGWIRYSTPWLALLSVGIPAAIWHSRSEFGEQLHRLKLPSLLIGILVLTSINPIYQTVEDVKGSSEGLYEKRTEWSQIYKEVGSTFDKNSTVITGLDITMGLHSETACFRYEEQWYPILQAINKFNASHVFTQDIEFRYDIDINSTFLFGSPIEPIKEYTSNERVGRLWQVSSERLSKSDWWRNSTIEVNGSGAHSGDFIWLENGSNFELLEHTAIHRIYETNSQMILQEVFDVLAHNRQNLLCDTVEDCSQFNRTEHLDTNWAVWMTKLDSV
tara:strand:+ start:2816 stop:4711 length:1896 start_codon:yes stop_codon:yes gene_type:complete